MALWDTLTDAGSNLYGQVTDTAGNLWETARGGVERAGEFFTDQWVREKTGQLEGYEREAEAVFASPWAGFQETQSAPDWAQPPPEPEQTAQPKPPSMFARFALPVGGLLLAGLAAFALLRR